MYPNFPWVKKEWGPWLNTAMRQQLNGHMMTLTIEAEEANRRKREDLL